MFQVGSIFKRVSDSKINRDKQNPYLGLDYPISYVIYIVLQLRPKQNGRHLTNDIFKRIFLKISLKFVPKIPINKIPALVQISHNLN